MRTMSWLASMAAIGAAILPACDAINMQELRPGVSTAAEVRARMGLPTAEHPNPDGSVTYEYSRQPSGVECHMLTIGPDQVLQKIEQALSEANLARVTAGLSREQVRRMLGKAGSITTYKNSGEEVWDWRIPGTPATDETHFHVHFDPMAGVVTRTTRRVEMRGG